MNAIVQTLNTAGRAFVDFAVPMLIQSSLLILILLAVDAILRKRVRAVFRYWIWMLVLVKLVLPPSLWSPVSVGTWFGDKLEISTAALLEAPEPPPVSLPQAELLPAVTNISSQPPRIFTETPRLESTIVPPAPMETTQKPALIDTPLTLSLNWHGFALLTWGAVVAALLLLLAQRTFFVQGLVAQADEAGGAMLRELNQCCRHLGLHQRVSLRLSPNATSPAVCGLLRPVILIPQSLASRLHGADLQAVLYHELAHVQRGDLWINLLQTLLQIVYFYSPLLWLANTAIRRIREKAVDETVLVALGEAAPQYPETLVNVAKLAFARRPTLSLRLIGVVESRSALTSRIKHILNRPLPKTAKLGLLGLLVIFLIAAVLLPMARGKDVFASAKARRDQVMVVRWMAVFQDNVTPRLLSDSQPVATASQSYQAVRLGSAELLTRVRDYAHGNKILYLAEDLKWLEPSPKYPRADSWSYTTNLKHPVYRQCSTSGTGPYRLDTRPTEAKLDLQHESVNCFLNPGVSLQGSIFFKGSLPPGQALVFAAPLQNDGQTVATHLVVWQAVRVPKNTLDRIGSIRSAEQWVEDGPNLSIVRARMPVKKLLAHQYYQADGPIWLYADGIPNSPWQPKDLHRSPRPWPYLLLIDGKEYSCSQGFGPFDGVGGSLDIWDNIYVKPGDSPLRVGRHVVAYGWKNLDVVDPNDPDQPLHFDRLLSDPVAFEVVGQVPQDYYRQVYQEGWEDILRHSIETPFTDDPLKHGGAGPLLTLEVHSLPFDIAFEIYAQAEGSVQRQPAGQAAVRTSPPRHTTTCDPKIEGLNWSTAGDKRWRLILVPSEKVAVQNPPIHEFYGREFVTDWISFERSPQFEQHRREFEHRGNNSPADAQPASVPGAKDFVCTLPNGMTVELLGICEHPSADRPWWRPDGGPLAIRPYDRLTHTERSPAWKHYEVLFRVQGAAGEVSTKLKPGYPQILGSSGPGSVQDPSWAQTSHPQGAENLFSAILFVEPEVRQVQLELGIGIESAWETRGELEGQIDSGSVAVPGAMFGPAIGKDGRTSLTVAHRILDREIRLLALDKKGQAHKPTGLSARESSDLGHCQAEFDLPIANIASIQLQTQQLTWVTFQNVPLDPNLSTRVAAPAAQGEGGGALGRSEIVNPSAGSSPAAAWQNVGPALPPDANDARTLAPGVVLEGSGADVEEKAFISCLRDLAQTDGRQCRFVLVTKEGQTLEPRYYTSLPRDGSRLWEKFTFDASPPPWKLDHFQLQSRPVPADRKAVAPSAHEDILARAAVAGQARPAQGAPPGRYGLSFDGQGDYLYIPDSNSLRQAAALTVEMWIKPQLPEGPHINRPRWGLLGHGAYVGTGHVALSGFGIKIDGLDPASKNLMIDYGEALGDGINCTILGELFSDNWVHISHTFGHGSYRPAPGHPMIVGRYLIPSEDPYPGQIGEIRLWNSDKARESDIRRYENVALTGKEPGLVACWTFEEGQGQIAYDISPNANHARLGSSLNADYSDPQWVNLTATGPVAANEISGRVVDPNGQPVAGAQVALCTKDKGVDIQAGQLLPTRWGGKGGEIVKTDAQGQFSFAAAPDEFNLVAAHDTGFAWITNKELAASGALCLEPWGRIEGTLKIGRELGAGERISLQRGGNRSAADQNIHLDYETYADSGGRFTFARVPPTWMEVGYLIRTGDSTSSDTGRTPLHLLPGQNLKMTLGGEGRPVIGKFVPPQGYKGLVYFGEGLRALETARPDLPKPANYDQMTKREQQQWLSEWTKTPQAEAYYDALWHDLNRRHYTFRIQNDGTFRIEDVIPGRYQFTVWLEEQLSGQGRPEEIGAYYGTIEVPAIPGGRTDEPLDLGNLTVGMRSPPLHVGDMAPLFEAKTLDGKDVRLADYRGRFVLLSFWQPTFHPELDRLKELYQTYSGAGKLAIIDFAGGDTLEEVKKYIAERQIEWPEIYLGRNWESDIFKQYGDPSASYILLVDPEGKIVATWLREEKLTQTVKDALGQTN